MSLSPQKGFRWWSTWFPRGAAADANAVQVEEPAGDMGQGYAQLLRNLPGAVPGIGECQICCELVPCVKLLECGHAMCTRCASQMVRKRAEGERLTETCVITCPECRVDTRCASGVHYLATRYFGKVKCDLCLTQKDTDDLWWCENCVQAICSKCNIKEHAGKKHQATEWNRLDPVNFSMQYLQQLEHDHKAAHSSEINKMVIKAFMQRVEESITECLTEQPTVENLKNELISKYGLRFDEGIERSISYPREYKKSTGTEPKVVEKVLALAGHKILDNLVPNSRIPEQNFQLYFSIAPEEVAKFIASKVEYIPLEHQARPSAPPAACENGQLSTESAPAIIAPVDRLALDEEVSFTLPRPSSQLLACDVSNCDGLIVLCYEREVVLCATVDCQTHTAKAAHDKRFRTVRLHKSHAYVVSQSQLKTYEWTLEIWDANEFPHTVVHSAPLDIDHDDKVYSMRLCVTPNDSIFEARNCDPDVGEVWIATWQGRKKDKRKLKEVNVYQKTRLRFGSIEAIDMGGKEKVAICYEELSRAVLRLTIQNNKCVATSRVVLCPAAEKPLAIAMSGYSQRLWLFDLERSRYYNGTYNVLLGSLTAQTEPSRMTGVVSSRYISA